MPPISSQIPSTARPSFESPQTMWTDSFLDSMRLIGDSQADAAVRLLFQNGHIGNVNRLMNRLLTNEDVPLSELPAPLHDYLASTSHLPAWADPIRVQRAQRVFSRYGLQIGLVLFHGSLPISYAARKGVHVLALTQRLARNPYHRILNTAQFLLDTMTPGAMQQGARGLRSVQKVRLIHAAVRHLLLDSGQWDSKEYDYPINQEDLAGTLMMFSSVIHTGLRKIGIELTDQEADDYQHIWSLVGAMMGIVPEMTPGNAREAALLTHLILRRNIDPQADNSEGRELMQNLLRMLQKRTPGGKYHAMPQALTRHLVGDSIADLLEVPRTPWQNALRPIRWANLSMQLTGKGVPTFGKLSEVFCRKALEGLLIIHRQGNFVSYEIPDELSF